MLETLKNKKAIFFDVGYTLDYPASGDWMLTKKFYELVGDKLNPYTREEVETAKNRCFEYLNKNHVVKDCNMEYEQFTHFYAELSDLLHLGLTKKQTEEISYDRTFNMQNYRCYTDAAKVLETLSKTYKLGVISDTWPSIVMQLESFDILKYFTTTTYSCDLGVLKPDKRMYIDALEKMGVPAEDTVFIDDIKRNVLGAAELGITPILIAANPVSDVEVPFDKIHSLSELL